jgi:hypothetical protein
VALDPLDTVTGPEEEDVEEPEPTITLPLDPIESLDANETSPLAPFVEAALFTDTKPEFPSEDGPLRNSRSPPNLEAPACIDIDPLRSLASAEETTISPEVAPIPEDIDIIPLLPESASPDKMETSPDLRRPEPLFTMLEPLTEPDSPDDISMRPPSRALSPDRTDTSPPLVPDAPAAIETAPDALLVLEPVPKSKFPDDRILLEAV